MDETELKTMTSGARRNAVIFIGLQASGKSEFYRRFFAATHVRINLDELHTRGKEQRLLEECIRGGKAFAVDNTNPKAEDRARYIAPAKQAGYTITGMYFKSTVTESIARNANREGKARVPDIAIMATAGKMEAPEFEEGFDEIYHVSIEGGEFRAEKLM
jgi:predicted kinase